MSVSLFLITHLNVGLSLYQAVEQMFLGKIPLKTSIISITDDVIPEQLVKELLIKIEHENNSGGTLILTDLFGSTPCNIATLLDKHKVKIVSGLNLPMLTRIMNYPEQPLEELVETAIEGGKKGIIQFKN